MEELRPQDLEDLLQELEEECGTLGPVPRRARICPKCGKHNLENAWHCIDCGTTLSMKTLMDVEDGRPSMAPIAGQRALSSPQLPGTDKQLHRSDTKGGLLSRRLLMWSSVAGLAVGLVIGLALADPSLSSSLAPGLWAVIMVALTAGTVVGAVVGAVVQGPKDRITGMMVGAALAAVVASLSWFPVLIWRLIQMGY